MPYWDHEEETQFLASPLCDSYNKGKMPGLSLRWTGLFSFMCPPPHTHRLSEKSRREQKSLYPTTGATTDSQSSLGGTFTFKTVSPTTSVCKGIFDVFGAHLGCLPAMVYSGRISGVCLQWCIQGASQVFACNGVFRAHLGCLPAMIQGASQVFACNGVFRAHLRCLQLTGTVIGPVSA